MPNADGLPTWAACFPRAREEVEDMLNNIADEIIHSVQFAYFCPAVVEEGQGGKRGTSGRTRYFTRLIGSMLTIPNFDIAINGALLFVLDESIGQKGH